jgi:hypothetical protein
MFATSWDSNVSDRTLAANDETKAPICTKEGEPCGPPSLDMTCQRQGNGAALVCRALIVGAEILVSMLYSIVIFSVVAGFRPHQLRVGTSRELAVSSAHYSMSDIFDDILTLSDYTPILPTWEAAMSDGPFRNAELPSSWKRYGQDLVSDAASREERTTQACHSMIGDADMKTFSPLFDELKAHADRPQMDLDPVTAVETIFETHPTSPLADTLQRHLIANLRDQIRPEKALDQALDSTAKERISTTKNRLDEECIRARELGDMSREDYRKGIERNRETFAAIKPSELCDALATGNKRAFRQAVQKKAGVDEGPEE